MKYPDEFETPAFPAGKRIAVSRSVSVAIMVVFLLILITCGLILWAQKSVRVHPFLVSVNNITGQWELVGHKHHEYQTMTTDQTLQESLITKFIQNWFLISGDADINNALWQSCSRESECTADAQATKKLHQCDIFCNTDETTFNEFINNVVPQYQTLVANNVQHMLDENSVHLIQIGSSAETGNIWQVNATLISNAMPPVQLLIYVTVMKDTENYPQTMGYYVASLNAYKIN